MASDGGFVDHYATLGFAPGPDEDPSRTVTLKAVERAYKRLALALHPDKSKEADAPRRFEELQRAIAVLRDPERRAAFDASYVEAREREARELQRDAHTRALRSELRSREARGDEAAREREAAARKRRQLDQLRRETEAELARRGGVPTPFPRSASAVPRPSARPFAPASNAAGFRTFTYDEHVARERRILARMREREGDVADAAASASEA